MKTKTKIVVSLFIIFSIFSVSNAWWNYTTEIVRDTNYTKKEWIYTLKLKQKKYVNDFAWKKIERLYSRTTGKFLWYYVDNVRYGNTAPNQRRLTWINKTKTYKYDSIKPTCQWVSLFEDWNTNKPVTLWSWTNKNIKARITCYDRVSWCVNKYSSMLPVWYKIKPKTTFRDNAQNFNTCQWNLGWKLILIDKILPKIRNIKIWGENFSLLKNDPLKNVLANPKYKDISFSMEDIWNSTNWISWIKSYDFSITYKKDHKWNWVGQKICSKSWTYNAFNPIINWKVKEIKDSKNISFSCDWKYSNWNYKITKSWQYELTLEIKDFAWNSKKLTRVINVYPNSLSQTSSDFSLITTWDKYGNNNDYYEYKLSLRDKYDNAIYGKSVQELEILNNPSKRLELNWWWKSNQDWEINFQLRSLSPYSSFKQDFKITLKSWTNSYQDTSIVQKIEKKVLNNNSFKKPVKWEISLKWWWIPELWKDQEYEIKLSNIWNISNYKDWNLKINKTSIVNTVTGHVWNWNFSKLDNNFWVNLWDNISFVWKIDATSNVLQSPSISSKDLEISYVIWWKKISYKLDNFWFWEETICSYETLWLKVIWELQWAWKIELTWQEKNYSDLSKWEIREDIRKKAYSYIRNMSWDKNKKLNWVIYVDWDINYKELKNKLETNDTLIVRNWNLIIDEDIKTKIWIIVLSDNYNVKTDYNKKWNVYVLNTVSKIRAIIYADGTFRSWDANWESYADKDLWDRLDLKWSLFTRNTIWWAVLWSSSYVLPWWESTNNYALWEIYDLNYVRKVSKSCDGDSSNDYSFVIEYDPEVKLNPPRLFWE